MEQILIKIITSLWQLMEGTLNKACRSKDKSYRFLLFNDALLYATQVRPPAFFFFFSVTQTRHPPRFSLL